MLIIQGYNAVVDDLKDDSFYLMRSLYNFMKPKIHDKDLVFRYHNYKKTNLDYWGYGFKLMEKLVNLPKNRRDEINYIVFSETDGNSHFGFIFYKNYYFLELNRKHKGLHKYMDRLQEIFQVEDERRPIIKNLKYLQYVLSWGLEVYLLYPLFFPF